MSMSTAATTYTAKYTGMVQPGATLPLTPHRKVGGLPSSVKQSNQCSSHRTTQYVHHDVVRERKHTYIHPKKRTVAATYIQDVRQWLCWLACGA